MTLNIWSAVPELDPVPVLAANWAEMFLTMQSDSGCYTKFGEDMMAALTAHCNALNALDGNALGEYMRIVDTRVTELEDYLAYSRRLLDASAGLNVANTVPTAVAAFNFWNPVGWIAGGVSVGAAASSITCKVIGENALERMASMIQESPCVIKDRASKNPISLTASTMEPLAQLLTRKFGEEKANAAYFVLLSAILAYSDTGHFDVNAIPSVVAYLVKVATSDAFLTLLQAVRNASLSRLTPCDAVKQFGASMRASSKRLVGAITDQSISCLTVIAGCVLKPVCKNASKGLEVLLLAIEQGAQHFDAALLMAKEAQVASIFNLAGKLSVAFTTLAVIGAVVAAGFGIYELVAMNTRLEPYKKAIEEIRTYERNFAEVIEDMPKQIREFNNARFVGHRNSVRPIARPSTRRIQ